MARAIDLFIDHPGDDPHQVLVRIGAAVHQPPVPTTDGGWDVRLAEGLSARFGPHGFVDDDHLPLRGYRWSLAARVPDGPGLLEHPATAALRMVADELRHQGTRVLLVLDLQHRVPLGGDPQPAPVAPAPAPAPAEGAG